MSISETINAIIEDVVGSEMPFEVTVPEQEAFGHYSTSIALKIAKTEGKNPHEVAERLRAQIIAKAPKDFFEKVEVAGLGFINFWITPAVWQKELADIVSADAWGRLDLFAGKRILVEYTDPNPFKEFHIGHLVPNLTGESIARLFEASGAEVMRLNYQGDVGLHVAKSIWGMMHIGEMPDASTSLDARARFLGQAYAMGAKAYEEDAPLKEAIDALNKKVYERSDVSINELYDTGRKWSLDYFETMYARLGTKFTHYFFESETGPDGLAIVRAHPDVFTESQGAIIFAGEKYGLHSRVFINTLGLPTYEAKELGLNKKKFDLYHPDRSFIVTGNEINDYFRVLLKVMELTIPEVATRTTHIGHGMLRLPEGKMSSRTGNVITAESLIEEVKQAVAEKVKDNADLSADQKEYIKEKVAIGAIRYSILKQSIGSDIIFDIKTSVAFSGNSGPYLQYTYARLMRIIAKAGTRGEADYALLRDATEFSLVRALAQFPETVRRSVEALMPNTIAEYCFNLASLASRYYEETPILKDESVVRRDTRLALIGAVAKTLKNGLALLGIETPEEI